MDQVRAVQPEVVVVDYVPSAVFVPSLYATPVPRVTITLKREGEYYREVRRHGLPPDASPSRFAGWRAGCFERWVYRHSDAVVALTASDLPSWQGAPRTRVVIPPCSIRIPAVGGTPAHGVSFSSATWLTSRTEKRLSGCAHG